MNPALDLLRPYPFERLRALLAGARPPAALAHINLSIGEPRHPTPAVLTEALAAALGSLSAYPSTTGTEALREAIAAWLGRRHGAPIDPATQVLPVAGSREALFSFAQAVIDRSRDPLVVVPNPAYQVYEGAAVLAGATVRHLPSLAAEGWRMPFEQVAAADWPRVQLVYVCSPDNPTGRVMPLPEWSSLFALADRHGFVIASDECYSEIYCDEAAPPLGALAAARALGRDDYARLLVFGSLSKRSNAPGLRSGFVAGDAAIVRAFLRYRTFHGCALGPAVQAASIAAWNDEAHVVDNRRRYAAKFDFATTPIAEVLPTRRPDAAFYLWARTPGDDTAYARSLYEQQHLTVLPGSYLARTDGGTNPGAGHVRLALVAEQQQIEQAVARIRAHAGHPD